MAKLPYYPMFTDDFNNSDRVFSMTLAEIGLYALALNASWTSGSLPADPHQLALLIRKPAREVMKAWPKVAEAFTKGPDGRLRNARQELEREKVLHPKSTERVKRHRERLRNENGTQSETLNETDLEPFLELKTKLRASGSGSVSDSGSESKEKKLLYSKYTEFVEKWPVENRRGVDFGCQFWICLVDSMEITEATLDEIFQGLERWKTSESWNKEDGKYIPTIADPEKHGWLQKRAWKDHPKQQEVDSWR